MQEVDGGNPSSGNRSNKMRPTLPEDFQMLQTG